MKVPLSAEVGAAIAEAVRALGLRRNRFPPALERSFNDATWTERYREFRFWLWGFLVFAWLALGLTYLANPEELALAAAVRLFVITPAYLTGIWLLSHRQPRHVEFAAAILPHVLALVCVEALFLATAGPDIARNSITLTFGILATNFVVPMRSRQTIAYTALTVAIGDALIATDMVVRHGAFVQADTIMFNHMVVALSVFGRVRAEAGMRRGFLRGLLLRRRTDELARANERLLEISITDPLTGVANRRSYEKVLLGSWNAAMASGSPLAVLMIDVDRFKSYNDRLGHLQGDECLRAIARAIVGQTRRGRDVVGRFGGEEFVMLLPNTDRDTATAVAERVRRAVASLGMPHPGGNEHGVVTVSIGVAALDDVGTESRPDGLLAAADRALYAAKLAGRNRVCVKDPEVGHAL